MKPWMGVWVAAVLVPAGAQAQESTMQAGTLAHDLDRVAVTARVLYVAAHPDDENTRLLAYLANHRHVAAAYLSMTRGGGGQNLIGREQDELLDVVRTEELLAARSLDHAAQRFTRMRDFGYSKTAEETLAFWGHDEALADVVWVIRSFQPDVIITRFDEQPPNHGHHTASAILAREAFAAAADPQRFPEQLALGVSAWKAERLLHNVPQWNNAPAPKDAISLDVGAYDVRLGLSYGELAARSRSQHKSQGFGVIGERGPLVERFVTLGGSRAEKDLLDGVELGWARFGAPGVAVAKALDEARAALDRDAPEHALPALLRAHRLFEALPDQPRVRDGRAALDRVIAGASGVFVRAAASRPGGVPGTSVPVKLEVIARRSASIALRRVVFPGSPAVEVNAALGLNEKKELSQDVALAADAPISTPYWLVERPLAGRHPLPARDARLVGEPKGPPPLSVNVELAYGDRVVRLETPVVYVWNDHVLGERARSFLITPPATVTPARRAVLFLNGQPAPVVLRVRAASDDLHGEVVLGLPAGWRSEPASAPVVLAKAGEEMTVRFVVTPGAGAVEAHPELRAGGRSWSYREDQIDYAHIPLQVVLRNAFLSLVPVSLKLPKGTIGYIEGSGDTVAEDLSHVGLAVETIDEETLKSGDLARYATIVVGIRAYNTRPVMKSVQARLLHYVESGGTLVVQYQTNSPIAPLELAIGPFPLEIGRDRITDETAEMTPLDAKSPLLLAPNRVGPEDFAGWVQERGLYYASKWDDRYAPLYSAKDPGPGEKATRGGVLIAKHGRGRWVYTGLSFFRQLPAGVPGAYRLFVNLISPVGRGK